MADAGDPGRRRWSTPPAGARADVAGRATAGSSARRAPTSTAATRARRRRLRRRARPGRPPHPPAPARAGRRPRRSRPARRAAALGGYTAVVAMPNTDAGHRLAARGPRGARPRRDGALCDVHVGRRHHRRPGGRAAGADGRDGGARRAALHRRRHRRAGRPADAPGPRVRRAASASMLAQHCEDEALAGGGAHARGGVVEPARHARPAGRGRGADGAARHRAGPAHRRPGPLPAPVDGAARRAGAGGPGGRVCRSPPRRRPTTSPSPTRAAPATTRCSR